MFDALKKKEKRVAVIGLGYVGLPLALEFAKHFSVIGYDLNAGRVEQMKKGIDPSGELEADAFLNKDIEFSSNEEDLRRAHFFIVAVPTPVDEHKTPDLSPLKKASKALGRVVKQGDYVVFESTVYPGCTEEDCVPLIEKGSGLKIGDGFKVGYSPERIVPGDRVRTIDKILKIVSGSDDEALENIALTYGEAITAGVYKASSIKVAEAAKVIENTQRDLNISLMNELSIIFDKMGIDTREVIEAAGTKWNFVKLFPGLVGGHCIGVDPYYLLHKSTELGYSPQVILSGRRINDGMPAFIAKKLVQMLSQKGKSPRDCKVLVMGLTFKEDVSDIRNSKVADLVRELEQFSLAVDCTDPHADEGDLKHEYGLKMTTKIADDYDAIIVAVAHREYASLTSEDLRKMTKPDPVLMDLKGIYDRKTIDMSYWRL